MPDVKSNMDVKTLREQFPILEQKVNGHPLVYFDNAATTQKPKRVLEAMASYYQGYNSNIHRGVHTLAEKATSAFEETRRSAQTFINAAEPEEIIFTSGTTDGINLVSNTLGRSILNPGDEVVISALEHHSNIVPWQLICEQQGSILKVIDINEDGSLDLDSLNETITDKTKIVSVAYASNSFGVIHPVKKIIEVAKSVGAKTVIDAAQAAPHLEIDVKKLNCDFLAFSAHKMYGPTGVGVLYGKRSMLEQIPPYKGGGEMIAEVSFEKTTYAEIPYKFEAGTPNIADVVAFGEAFNFISDLTKDAIGRHETELVDHAQSRLSKIPGIKIYGYVENKVSVVSFILEGMHPFDLGLLLDAKGIAVRTGHHCTQPLMARFGIEGTVRASFAVYNTIEEVDRLCDSVLKIVERR